MHRAPRLALAAALLFAASPLAACIESAAAPDDDAADATAPDDTLATIDADASPPSDDGASSADTVIAADAGADAEPGVDIVLTDVPTGAACPCEPACPTAVIGVAQGFAVSAPTTLRVSGAESTGAAPIVHYDWSVQQPHGGQSAFLPSAAGALADVTLPAHVAGNYELSLVVTDANGARSCRARQIVEVTPPDGVYIELLWDTPGDPDQTDVGFINNVSAGTDLDLHLLHPDAATDSHPEGWFSPTHDVYWATGAAPLWGGGDASSPELVRDDTDGAGPEAIHFAEPSDGVYRVGVHYWDAWSYGASWATVRIYVDGSLVFELADIELDNVSAGVGDLWEVATIAWPSATVAPITAPDAPDTPFIRAGYSDPATPL